MGDLRQRPAIKICGLTDTDQALEIAALGVDAIGVIGVERTPRHLAESQRRQLFAALEQAFPKLLRVWVVADLNDDQLDRALDGDGPPSVVQLHGSESPERCRILRQKYPEVQWWKALRLREANDLNGVADYCKEVDALLLDAWSPSHLGGTGHRLPLEWLNSSTLPLPWWLAGGISAEWVATVLEQTSPHGLDASSRLEQRPGWKDLTKVKALVEAVHSCEK